jgi:hypothetical protein
MTARMRWFLPLLMLMLVVPARAEEQSAPQQPPRSSGRVVVSATALGGTVPMSGVEVDLRQPDGYVIAETITDSSGQATFPDVPPGQYIVHGARPGFVATQSAPFSVDAGAVVQVVLEVSLTFVAPDVDVTAPAVPADIPEPVSTSDMLAGSLLDVAPLQGDDFESLLPLLPGVVRGPDGRLRAKGGQPAQSALQISSTSLNDPTTGDFDLQVPGQSLESVELLANPFSAEYGRFSTTVVQLRTRRGTNEWETEFGNLVPRFRKGLSRLRRFEPRFSVRGPFVTDRVFFAQDFQFRYVSDPVRSLPDEPTIDLTSFDSFTRVDGVVTPSHSLGALVVMFPREVSRLGMDTFRPPSVSPNFLQRGVSLGLQDRYALSSGVVLESTVAVRKFSTTVESEDDSEPMIFTPETRAGHYFNDQERDVTSLQWVETLTTSSDLWRGQHQFKVGLDVQHSRFDGTSTSRAVEIHRLDGSLAESIAFGRSRQDVSATEVAIFAQDRWRLGSRMTFEYGVRLDRDDVVKDVNWSPRGGVSLAVLPEGRGILRFGIGSFSQRTPLNISAFEQYESRVVTRFAADGRPVSVVRLVNTISRLETPTAVAGNIEWNQRFTRRVLLKANYLRRHGADEHLLQPDPSAGELRLAGDGTSRYSELELTMRYLGGDRRDLTASYVHSSGTADLNGYDQFYGNMRSPIVRPNERGPIASDVPHRLLVRGTLGLPGGWLFAPVLEIRSGFPWSAVDEFQDFVGPRNRTGRLPAVRTLDVSLTRAWRFWKYRFNAGIRVYNILGAAAERDVQTSLASPRFGQFFNPLERSIGIVLGATP